MNKLVLIRMKKKIVSLTFVSIFVLSIVLATQSMRPVKADPAIIRVPDDYEKIQWAVSNASAGDIIQVAAGTYYEQVIIGKSLTLIGENPSTTIIQASLGADYVIKCLNTSRVNISGFTMRNGIHGIKIEHSSNNTIRGNTITNNSKCGIHLSASNNNTISGNMVSSNGKRGIYMREYCYNNVVSNNTVLNHAEWGLYLKDSFNNVFSNNTISNSEERGIFLNEAGNNIFIGNTVSNNDIGITIRWSPYNKLRNNKINGNRVNFDVSAFSLAQYTQDMDSSNTVNGKPIYYWMNEEDKQVPAEAGYVAVINSKNITVKDQTLTKNQQGVLFAYTTDSTILNVNASYNEIGIDLFESDNNNIYVNFVKNSSRGIQLDCSHGNILTANNVTNNNYGIYLSECNNNRIYHNRIIDNGGITGEAALFGGGIYLADYSNGNNISDNTVASNVDGIHLYHDCKRNIVTSNMVSNSTVNGVFLQRSSNNNSIFCNTILNNRLGINLTDSWANNIYHNNFIKNTNQAYTNISTNAWDDGYPSGGNYWSNYTGIDEYSGVNQDELGSDGIGDTPHIINKDNQDNYPLMTPIILVDQIVTSDDRCNMGSLQTVAIHAVWAHNSSNVVESSVYVNGTKHVTNGTGWVRFYASSDTVGKHVWTVERASGLISCYIIWDRVQITLSNRRVNVNSATSIVAAVYEYDGAEFDGVVTLNDTLTKSEVGLYGYTAQSIGGGSYNITVFESNSAWVIFDAIKIVEGGVSKTQTNLNQEETVWFKAIYEYDAIVFDGTKGTLYVNGSAMTWSSTNNRWEHTYSFQTAGTRTFQVSGVYDKKYALTAINDAVGAQSITWTEVVVPFWTQWWFWAAIVAAGIVVFVLIYFLKVRKPVKRRRLA